VPLPTSIVLPDQTQYTLAYEDTPNNSGYKTARVSSVTTPTGGSIQYQYSLTALCQQTNLTRTLTPGGVWTYQNNASGTSSTTYIIDPVSSPTSIVNINFQGIYETSRRTYNKDANGTTLVETDVTCYNGNTANCDTTAVTTPISQRTATRQLAGGLQSKVNTLYNSIGLVTEVDEYNWATGAPGVLTHKTLRAYAALGNNIQDRPTSITVQDGGSHVIAQTTYVYDEAGYPVQPTTGTPNHSNISGSRGNPTTINKFVTAATSISSHFKYYDTGNVYQVQDVNGVWTPTYTYGACGNSFPTNIAFDGGLSNGFTWNCNGGVMTSSTDENNKQSTVTFADANFWRATANSDQLLNVTTTNYLSPTQIESYTNFNSGQSTIDRLNTMDGFGRALYTQNRQAPGLSSFDSVQSAYDAIGRPYQATVPYVGIGQQQPPPGTATSNTSYDSLGRVSQVQDGGGGTVTYNYLPSNVSANDVLITRGPAPTRSNQLEYDALGRLTSVCEITTGNGSGPCGQSVGQTGFLTTYTYDTTTMNTVVYNRLTVSQNAQSSPHQTRTYVYDLLNRLIQETNPESGTVQYFYDTAPTTPGVACSGSYTRDLVKKYDAQGNTICYTYDTLHRLTSIAFPGGPNSATTPKKMFVYDSATVNGSSMALAGARLAEAYTCTGSCTSKITDLGFSYDARGSVLDVYQSTPHSGGYYHLTTAQYYPNFMPSSLSGLPGLPTLTYGLEGEGRLKTITAGSGQNPVTGTIYDLINHKTTVTLGSSDSDVWNYDPNTGRMSKYTFNVNNQAVTGTLTWNANGTLGSLAITDPYNINQTCSYGYDSLLRTASNSCTGSGWSQSFSFDSFGNDTKTGSITWACPACYDATTNRYNNTLSPLISYDSNGNLLNDTFHTYSWDAEGRPVTVDTVGLTYDALGRMAEQARGTNYAQIVYSPWGSKLALMNGQTLQNAFVSLPGGDTAVYAASGLAYYRHADWLGSSRFASTPGRAKYFDVAYAPYGEDYTDSGTTDLNFTGQNQATVPGMYDFLYREYHPRQGRWISPDPAGLTAVDMTDPQTWNRFAYVSNSPLNSTDPLGLCGLNKAHDDGRGGCPTSGVTGGDQWIMVDGVPTLSAFVSSMAETGAYYVPCTWCSIPNSNGGHYSITPTAGNAVWMYFYPNGSSAELSSSAAAELGLGDPQNIGSGSPGPIINSLIPGFNYNVRHWVNGALNRLKNTKCKNFFGGSGARTINNTTYTPIVGPTSLFGQTCPGCNFVEINVLSSLFQAQPGRRFIEVLTPGGLSAEDTGEVFVLHETSHQLERITHSGMDLNLGINMFNTLRVLQNCAE
jgi:RHS repeat-associated protein